MAARQAGISFEQLVLRIEMAHGITRHCCATSPSADRPSACWRCCAARLIIHRASAGIVPLHSVRLSTVPQRVVAQEVLAVARNEVNVTSSPWISSG
jgi:hypothetical protein